MKPRATYYLLRASFVLFYRMWLTVTLLYHAEMVTTDPLLLILLSVVHEGTVFLFEVPTGIVADSYSRKWSTIIGLLMIGSAYCLEGSAPIYGRVLLAQFIYGVGFTFFSGANDAWIADEIGPEQAAPVFMRGTQISLIFGQIGIISAIVIGQFGVQVPLIVAGIAIIVLGLFLAIVMREEGFSPEKTTSGVRAKLMNTVRQSRMALRTQPLLLNVVLVGFVVGTTGGFDRLFTPHFLSYEPQMDAVIWYGLLEAAISLASAVVLEAIRRRATTLSSEQVPRTIALLYLGTIVGNIVFVLAGNFGMAVMAFWFSQMFRNTTRPLIIIWINQFAESRIRATAISMYWQSNALGQVVGSPFVGLIGRLFSLRVALMASVLALSPTLWLLTRNHDADETTSIQS